MHEAGLTVTGVDVTGSTDTADYYQDDQGQGLAWVALTSGVTGDCIRYRLRHNTQPTVSFKRRTT